MAEISTYTCSHQKCRFIVRLSADFPVWHRDTPKELRTLTVSPEAAPYVVHRRNEALCSACHRVIDLTQEGVCTHCQGATLQITTQSQCPRCKIGFFSLTNLSVF